MSVVFDKYIVCRRILFFVFWVWATYGFLQEELFPFLASMRSIIFLGLDAVLLFVVLTVVRDRIALLYGVSFLSLAVISTVLVQGLSLVNLINGCRDFLPLLTLPLFYAIFVSDNRDDFIRRFDKHLFYFLVLQFPCIVFQFLKYGANDAGGGSLGWGYSGIISTLIYVISFYLIQKRWSYQNYMKDLVSNKLLVFLLFPSFLNETKVSFVFLLCYFLLLVKIDSKVIFKLIFAIPLVAMVMILLFNVYLSATGNEDDITSLEYYTDTYLAVEDTDELMMIGEMLHDGAFEDDDWVVDLPRFTKIMFFPALMESSGNSQLVGTGVSHFKGGTSLELTEFANEYQWALTGTVPYLYFLLVQLGYIGAVGFILYILIYGFSIGKKRDGRMLNVQVLLFVVVLVVLCYNDAFRVGMFNIIFCYILARSNDMRNLKENVT